MFTGCCVAFALLEHDIVVNLSASALLKIFEEKSIVRTGNSLVAVTNFPFAVLSLLAYTASHFCASYIFQVHQNPKGMQLTLPPDLQLY